MSAEVFVKIGCDCHHGCSYKAEGATNEGVDEVRMRLASRGWRSHDGNVDICPACSVAEPAAPLSAPPVGETTP